MSPLKTYIKNTFLWSCLRQLKKVIIGNNRRRIPFILSVPSFLKKLEKKNCHYVVLRWFDTLPHVDKGEDIDILVSDKDAPYFDRILTKSPILSSTILCDVYSETGLKGYEARKMAYYPPKIAKQILSRAIKHKSGAMVPCPEDHFFSLAYHALYHKGYKSGLAVSKNTPAAMPSPDHDYHSVLKNLATDISLNIDINMTDLDQCLSQKGWRPPLDTLDKLSVRNKWCRKLVNDELSQINAPEGLAIYVIREKANDALTIKTIKSMLTDYGFHVLFEHNLTSEQQNIATHKLRGGNWGTGPYPQSGGIPTALIAVIDPAPIAADQFLEDQHGNIDNARIFRIKNTIRDWWNDQQPNNNKCNIVHTSDNARHAMHYVQVTIPDKENDILEYAKKL